MDTLNLATTAPCPFSTTTHM